MNIESLLDRVGLGACHARHVGELTPEMMRRLGIAIALVKDPALLLLDEPLLGLAPAERYDVRALLVDIARERLVLFTTAEPDDVSLQCAEVALLHRGRLLLDGAMDRIIDDLRGRVWLGTVPRSQLRVLSGQYEIIGTIALDENVIVRVVSDEPPGSRFSMVEPALADAYWHALDRTDS